ncbi:sensor histidine kinase [Sphaerimonospora cavernae]|uniref:Sensor histidine kinase n=1 Tax=Sphaerimonospora cavernae TaxID=1740611 RepID=A0ABV6U3N2_9ACTN
MSRLARVFTFGGTDDSPARLRRLMGMSLGLIYLFYPLSDVTDGRVSGAQAVWRVIALAVFVAVYLTVVLGPRDLDRHPRWMFALLGVATAMGAAFPLLFGSSTWLALAVYLAIVYAMALQPRRALLAIAGMAAIVVVDGNLIGADGDMLWTLLLQVVTLGVLFMSVRNTRVLIDQLRQARSEAVRLAAAEERLRIARDLHDLLGHSLSLIVLKSELAGRLSEQASPKVAQEVADIESVARQALVEVREAVTGYRRRSLADELDGARAALAAAEVAPTIRTADTPLPADLDELFAWAVREAVTNVVRHARATRCEIELSYDEAGAVLEVTDDGRAGPYGKAPGGGAGSGLTGLTERVNAAGGTVVAGPVTAGTGFRLRVTVPRVPRVPRVTGTTGPGLTRTPDADRLTA